MEQQLSYTLTSWEAHPPWVRKASTRNLLLVIAHLRKLEHANRYTWKPDESPRKAHVHVQIGKVPPSEAAEVIPRRQRVEAWGLNPFDPFLPEFHPCTLAVCFATPSMRARCRAASCVLVALAARGFAPGSAFCARPLMGATRARPWGLQGRGRAASARKTVAMQILPEGGQSPCNIKVGARELGGRA